MVSQFLDVVAVCSGHLAMDDLRTPVDSNSVPGPQDMSVQQWIGDQNPATSFAAHPICYAKESGIRKGGSRDPQCFS